jgi:starch synthase
MVASEAAPYAKTGGLADVVGALPAALSARGEQVGVVLPLYGSAAPLLDGAERAYEDMRIWLTPHTQYVVNIRRLVQRDVTFFFVENPLLFGRPGLYGEGAVDYPDNHIRFATFCHAALGVIRGLFRPQIVHCHDWQAALIGPIMRHHFGADPTFYGLQMLMTIHNLGYQGLFPPEALADIGLSRDLFRPELLEYWGRISLLKGGIVYADAISTVSQGYAREIQTREFGFGLEGLLQSRSSVLTGIVNGVDYDDWSPEADRHIIANYTVKDLSGKRACKADLLHSFGLPLDRLDAPVIGIVSRFVGQKGFDLIEAVADELMTENIYITALGTGEPRYEQMMTDLARKYPDKVGVRVAYDNTLAHKIEAGSDMFLMPSRYEPCGLNQIYSLRYGTPPVVRATGGLDDTIDVKSGFKFHEYTGAALLKAIRAALDTYRDRSAWKQMMLNGMQKDYSWDASAAEYMALYRRMAG